MERFHSFAVAAAGGFAGLLIAGARPLDGLTPLLLAGCALALIRLARRDDHSRLR